MARLDSRRSVGDIPPVASAYIRRALQKLRAAGLSDGTGEPSLDFVKGARWALARAKYAEEHPNRASVQGALKDVATFQPGGTNEVSEDWVEVGPSAKPVSLKLNMTVTSTEAGGLVDEVVSKLNETLRGRHYTIDQIVQEGPATYFDHRSEWTASFQCWVSSR